MLSPWKKAVTNLDSLLKSRDITLLIKMGIVKTMFFPVFMCRCESWTIREVEHWRIDAFELWCWRRLKSPFDCKDIQPVHPKDQPWILIGRTDADAEAPTLCPPDEKSWFIGKDPDNGKDWGRNENRMTEKELVEWHHQLNGWVWQNSRR